MKSKILYLLLFASSFSCSKNSPGNNNNNQEIGPFTIYSGFVCPENNVGLINAKVEANGLFVSSTSTTTKENPIWYVKKISGSQYIIYDKIDQGYRLWFESSDNIENYFFPDCGRIAMQFMSEIPTSIDNKFLFTVTVDNVPAEQTTLITAPSGRSLLSGAGNNKNTNACTRSVAVFLSSFTACKDQTEGTELYTYCFEKTFTFKRK